MTKLIMLLVAAIFSIGLTAQQNKMQKNAMHDTKMMQMKDHLKMKDGKMMMLKNGKMMLMNKEMKMTNGIIVYPSGMVKSKDGKTMMMMMMMNGDRMDMDGMMTVQEMKDHLKMKDGKMMMVKEDKMIKMDKEMKMSNGTLVSPNGMIKMKDGKTTMMKNGDKMDMKGMVVKEKMK